MASQCSAPEPGEQASPGEPEHAPDERPAKRPERYGELALERCVKGDGRALILYSHGQRERA